MKIHREHGSVLGGIHLEMTGGATVTECTGGCANIFEVRTLSIYVCLYRERDPSIYDLYQAI